MSSICGGRRARRAGVLAITWLGLLAGAMSGGPLVSRAWAQQDTWTYYTDLRRVRGLALEADTMWVANSGGVVRFRRNLTPGELNPANYRFFSAFDGLAGNNAVAVAVDVDHNKWIAHGEVDAPLSIIEPGGNVRLMRQTDGLLLKPGKKANTVFASGDSVWAGTESGLTLFVNRQVRLRLDADDGLPSDNVLGITKAGNDIWIGTEFGLARLRNEALATFDTTDGLPSQTVLCLGYRSARNEVWIGTSNGPAFVRAGEDTIRAVTKTGILPGNPVNCPFTAQFAITSIAFQDTAVWVGTCGGPWMFRGTSWSTPEQIELRDNRSVGAMTTVGREVWVGFLREGPWRFDPIADTQGRNWRFFAFANTPSSDFFGTIDIEANGDIWLSGATKRNGGIPGEWGLLTRYPGTAFQPINPGSGFTGNQKWADIVRVDSQNQKWVGFWDVTALGMNVLNATNSAVDTVDIDEVCNAMVGNEPCTDIRIDGQGNIWSTWEFYGVSAINPATRQCVSWGSADGLMSDAFPPTNAIALDRQGRAWVGFARAGGGIASRIDTRGTLFNKSDDVIHIFSTQNSPIPSNLVHAVEIDSLGRVWFCTEAGLAIHNPADSTWIIHRQTASSRLLNESIRCAAFLPDGTALVGDNVGNVYTLASDARTFGPTYNITTVGFPNKRVSQIKYDVRRGAIWFALWGGGLVRLDRSDEPPSSAPPAGAIAWPNPWITDGGAAGVTVDHLPPGSSIWLYSLRGDLVRRIDAAPTDSSVVWDTLNDKGHEVASGVYLFVVRRDGVDLDRGKIAIIR